MSVSLSFSDGEGAHSSKIYGKHQKRRCYFACVLNLMTSAYTVPKA